MTAAAQLLLLYLRLLCSATLHFFFFAMKHPRLKNALLSIRNLEYFPEGSLVLEDRFKQQL